MKIKRAVLVVSISIIVIAAFLGMTGLSIHAESSETADSTVLAKLETVLSNQKLMMEDLAAIKEELRIIKIRITQSQ